MRNVQDLNDKQLLDLVGVDVFYIKGNEIIQSRVKSVARGFIFTNNGDTIIQYSLNGNRVVQQ